MDPGPNSIRIFLDKALNRCLFSELVSTQANLTYNNKIEKTSKELIPLFMMLVYDI